MPNVVKMPPKKKMPTIGDVARLAGSTLATVSRVINSSGYVSAKTRATVESAVQELGYVPNANARVLKTNRSRTIGLVVGDLLNPYAVQLASVIRRRAAEAGYTTFIGTAADDVESELSLIDAFHRQRVAGLIVATVPTAASNQMIARMVVGQMPVVLVGRSLTGAAVDAIDVDFRRGGELATQHLINLGHRRIAFVGAEMGDADRVTRLRGYIDAHVAAGLTVRPNLVLGIAQGGGSPRYSTHATGYQSVQRILSLPTHPTAIFARNDYTAFGVMQALRDGGFRIPDDFSLIGFDDVPLARHISPALSTISQPTEQEGQLALELLLARIEHPETSGPTRRVNLECALIARGTTGAAPRRRRP